MIKKRICLLCVSVFLIALSSTFVFATEVDVKGKNQKTYYEFSNAEPLNYDSTYMYWEEIGSQDDPHYSFKQEGLGIFFISGFSGKVNLDNPDEPLFLKTVGDELKIGFILKEDINQLAGNMDVFIDNDYEAYNGHFGTQQTQGGKGKGTLIVKYTNYQGQIIGPKEYINYLDGVKKGANTELIPCEEGDYEVALDYTIRKKEPTKFIFFGGDKVERYQIYFRFKIRNGNCMIFPKEIDTGNELTNKSITEKGFYLDLANSHYLDTIVKKEMLQGDNSDLTSDVRFNRAATDGEQFVEEGIYTISVYNNYTKESTEKKICVGNNNLLRANVVTGLPIEEINRQVLLGAIINNDGTIDAPKVMNSNKNNIENTNSTMQINQNSENFLEYYFGLGISGFLLLGLIILLIIIFIKKNVAEAKCEVDQENIEAKIVMKSSKKTIKVLIAILLIVALIIALLWYGLQKEKNYYKNLNNYEINNSTKIIESEEVKVVEQESVKTKVLEQEKESTIVLENENVIVETTTEKEIKKANEYKAKIVKMNYFDNKNRSDVVKSITDISDEKLLRYVQDDLYQNIIANIDTSKYIVNNIETVYLSKEYLEEVEFNSQENKYFGYSLSELDNQFQGKKYIFMVDEQGNTIATASQAKIENKTYSSVLKNIAIGGGVILVNVTLSALTGGIAPAVSTILAVSAKTGAIVGLSTGLMGSAVSGIVTGIQTGDLEEAGKAALLKGSEGFKWGVIGGSISGGVKEAVALHAATFNGLTMNEVAIIQKEAGYPLDVIKNFKNMEQYEICKNADLRALTIDGKTALMRPIDVNYVDEFGRTNLERMKKGLAAIDPISGESLQLHHVGQKMDSTLAVLTEAEHMQGGNNLIWHNPTIESEIDREVFDTIRENFWKDYAKIIS